MKLPRTFSIGDPSYFVAASTPGRPSPTVLTISNRLADVCLPHLAFIEAAILHANALKRSPAGADTGKWQHFQGSSAARRGPPSVQRPAIMSRERTNVIGIVALTMCVTAAALVGGWLAASRYLGLGQQTVTAAHEDAPAAPEPPKKTARASRSDGGRAGQPDGTPKAAGSSDAPVVKKDTAAHDTNEPVSTTPAADPQPDPAPARAAAETPLPSTAVASSTAPTAENLTDARAIVEESQRRSEARFYQYEGLLQSYDTNNTVTEKRWMFDRQGSHGQSKSVLRFTAPAEVKGVALLIYNHPERASDQWMWTPAIERDRRIAFQDRSTRFFGTDFTFEDLEERDVDQYDHNARRRYRRRSRLLENPVDAEEDPVFSVHTLDRLDPER
jgi:cell division septation protein DedD